MAQRTGPGTITRALVAAILALFFVALGPLTSAHAQTDTPPVDSTTVQDVSQEGYFSDLAEINTSANCTVSFSDVRLADWYYNPVMSLACKGVISGYADGTFRPYNLVTRGQLVKMVGIALGWDLIAPARGHFSDVPNDSVFFSYVETAVARGVVAGYSDGTFRPGNNMTRGQLSKVVVTAKNWPECADCPQTFSDVAPGSAFFNFVQTAVNRHIVSGYNDGSFRPGQTATRAQFASVLNAALNADAPAPLPTDVPAPIQPTPTETPQPAPTDTPAPAAPALSAEEQATIDEINSRRIELGLHPLTVNMELTAAGRRHANDVGPRGLCQHNGTDGSSPWDRAAAAGYTGFATGEVVGCGYPTPLGVVDGWWASPGHHDILVSPNVNEIGCGWWISAPGGSAWQVCLTGRR